MSTLTQEKVQERILLHRDEAKKTGLLQAFSAKTAELNALYQAWKAMNLGAITLGDLIEIDEPDSYVRLLIFENHKDSLGKLPLQRQALLQMIEMPVGFTDFVQKFMPLRSLKQYLHEFPLQMFTLENGRVKSSPALLAYIDNRCSTYAQTKEEIDSFRTCEQIHSLLTEIKGKYPHLNLLPIVTEQQTVFAKGLNGEILFNKKSTKNVKQ